MRFRGKGEICRVPPNRLELGRRAAWSLDPVRIPAFTPCVKTNELAAQGDSLGEQLRISGDRHAHRARARAKLLGETLRKRGCPEQRVHIGRELDWTDAVRDEPAQE